ncbi:UNVERIFIED_CONTAM: hypothetical protein K2H54_060719 [Gekko kuhli]
MTCWKTGTAFDWSVQDTTTHETWSLTLGLWRESRYEYEPVHKMGTRLRCGEDEMGWEDHLTCLEGLQDWLVQAVEEAVLEIPAMVMLVVQAEMQLSTMSQQSDWQREGTQTKDRGEKSLHETSSLPLVWRSWTICCPLPMGRGSFSSSKSPRRKEARNPTGEGIH